MEPTTDNAKLKDALIQEIEKKAPKEYRRYRRDFYAKLEGTLKGQYLTVLGIIEQGYPLLEDDSTTTQIARELWKYQKCLDKSVMKKHDKLAKKCPAWFNDNIRLQIQLIHPFLNPPARHRPEEPEISIMKSLGNYLTPRFSKKIEAAEKIAQIFLYFYGRDYPEINSQNIRKLI